MRSIAERFAERFPDIKATEAQLAIAEEYETGRSNVAEAARAGAGKSSTNYMGITFAPELRLPSKWPEVLVLQFNKTIATEGVEKVRKFENAGLLPQGKVAVKTFHSACDGYLKAKWKGVQQEPDKDREQRHATALFGATAPEEIVALVADLAVKAKEMVPFAGKGAELVDVALAFNMLPDPVQEEEGWTLEKVADMALKAMLKGLEYDGTRSFTDMIWVPLRSRWIYPCATLVVIDEFQDLSPYQHAVVPLLTRKNGRLFLVGDPFQTIYEWRGANPQTMGDFAKKFNAKILKLIGTFRCPELVVKLAQQVVGDYESLPGAQQGSITRMNFDKIHELTQPGDFVLSRKTAPLAKVCMRLLKHSIPAKIEGSQLGKGLVSLVKKIKGKSMSDFLVRLDRWSKKETSRFEELAKTKKSAQAHIEFVNDQRDVLISLSEGLSGLKELVARVESLFIDTKTGEMPNQVICSTVHKAKGREAARVFLLTESFFWLPSSLGLEGEPAPIAAKPTTDEWLIGASEEQRLFYVAVTRTKKDLVWVDGVGGGPKPLG